MPVREQLGFIYHAHRLSEQSDGQGIELDLIGADGASEHFQGVGNGSIAATVAALGLPLRIDSSEERRLGAGADAMALAILEAAWPGVPGTRFGVERAEIFPRARFWPSLV